MLKTKTEEDLYISGDDYARLSRLTRALAVDLYRFVPASTRGRYVNDHEVLREAGLEEFIREDGSAPFALYPQLTQRRLPNGKFRLAETKFANGRINPTETRGVSTFDKYFLFDPRGACYKLPKGTMLPDGLTCRPSEDVDEEGKRHYSIAPTKEMSLGHFLILLKHLSKKLIKS